MNIKLSKTNDVEKTIMRDIYAAQLTKMAKEDLEYMQWMQT